MLMATSLFSVNAFASNHENGEMHKEHRKEMREQHKNLSKEEIFYLQQFYFRIQIMAS